MVPFDTKRGYYGVSFPEGGFISYRAAAGELYEGELAHLGLAIFIIKKGAYLYRDIHDFMQHIPDRRLDLQRIDLADNRIDPEGADVYRVRHEWQRLQVYGEDEISLKRVYRQTG